MPNRNVNWYNMHSTRRYPLDDKATGTGDAGNQLKTDTLVDCHLRFPISLGRYAFLSGLTITDTIVTAVFSATNNIPGVTDFVPLCAITLLKPIDEYRHYAVEPLADGVGGFVVFGDVTEPTAWRGGTTAQGLLAPRVAHSYNSLPIPTLKKLLEADSLTGVITLDAGRDLEIVKEHIDLKDVGTVPAIVFRLLQTPGEVSVLSQYTGPCGDRPESRTCNKTPVETINGVSPDCDGNIDILYDDMLVGPYVSCGGETLDLPVGLGAVCDVLPRRLTDRFVGRDLCAEASSSSSSSSVSEGSLSSISLPSSSSSSSSIDCASLPYCENFDNEDAPFFVIESGEFAFDEFDSPSESCPSFNSSISSKVSSFSSSDLSSVSESSFSSSGSAFVVTIKAPFINDVTQQYSVPFITEKEQSLAATSGGRRNNILWDACAYISAEDKKVTTDLQITNLTTLQNGGIIINHRIVDPITNPHVEYFHALIDRPTNRLRLMQFTGGTLVEIAGVNFASAIQLDHWYRMTIETFENPSNPAQTVINVNVSGVTNPGWATTNLAVPTSNFQPDDGLYGLGSDRGYTRFSFFQIEERP